MNRLLQRLTVVVWLRLGLFVTAGVLGYLAQASMPGTVEAARIGIQKWTGAATGFRLYGWAGLCFVLACLPSVPHAAIRPIGSSRYYGEVLGALAAIYLIWGLAWIQWGKQYMLGFLPLFAGFAFLGMAKGFFPQKTAKPQEIWLEPGPDLSAQAKRPLWQWMVVHSLVWIGVGLSAYTLIAWYRKIDLVWPFWLLGGGIVLSAVGCYLRDRWMGIPLLTRKDLPQLWEVPFLFIIIGVAVYLRFWLLDKIPEGIWFDEAEIGLETRRILEGAAYSPMGAYSQNPSFPFYYNALFLKVLGDTLFALRCAVAVSGVLAVVGMYFLAREIFGRWAGLVAAMLLACGFWHINFSRFNMQNVHAPLFAIWMFYFLFRGVRNRRWTDFLFGGVMLGLGMHSYTGFRVVPPVLIPLTLIAMIFQKRFLRDYLYPLILMAVFSILVFGPLAAYAVRDWDKFTERTKETSVFRDDGGRRSEEQQWRDFKKNLIEHYQMFHYWGDRNPRHGLAAHPKVDFISGILMMLGLALAFYHLRDPRYFLLPVWLALGLLAGILSLEFESPQTARTIALLPVPFLLGAAALDQVRRFLIGIMPSFGKYLFGALAIVLLGWACNLNFDIYFNNQMTRGDTWSEFSGRDTAVARFMAKLNQNDLCYNNNATTRQSSYLIPEPKFQSRDFVTFRDLPPVEVFQSNQRISYILENWRAPLPERLWKHYFPSIQYEQHVNPENSPVFYTLTLPGSDINERHGVQVSYFPQKANAAKTKRSFYLKQPVIEPDVWKSRGGPSLPAEIAIEGIVYIPQSGPYRFKMEGDFAGSIRIGGREMTLESAGTLVQGWNDFQVKGTWQNDSTLRLLWQPPRQKDYSAIPLNQMYRMSLPDFGLLGHYYTSLDWSGLPKFRQIDPELDFRWHPDPPTLGTKWSARWTGFFKAPQDGRYLFKMTSNDMAKLYLDGHEILSQQHGGWPQTWLELKKGRHPIRIDYRQGTGYSSLRVRVIVPGRGEGVLGADYLEPGVAKVSNW